jgi:hypothetical protein
MMPAGEYYVGDLCYVMTDKEWDEFCSITIDGMKCIDGEFTMKDGRRFATYGTAWGDGVYQDQNNGQYAVDAGLIGCIKVEDIKAKKYADIAELGKIHTFQYDFTTSGGRGDRDWDGVIRIGSIHIGTNSDWYDDEK